MRVGFMNNSWLRAASLEEASLSRSVGHLQHLKMEIQRNDPRMDSMMFIKHNMPPWTEPANHPFEPSPVWHDEPNIVTDDQARTYLQNLLGKSKSSRSEFRRDLDGKKRKFDELAQVRKAIRDGRDNRDEIGQVQLMFALRDDLHEAERKLLAAETEMQTIVSAVGRDISIGAQRHNFKAVTFKIPTGCDLCGDRIWGLNAKGFDCKDCGYTCHKNCELKVAADCPGEQNKEGRKKLKAERQVSAASSLQRSLGSATTAAGSSLSPDAGNPSRPSMSGGGTNFDLSRSNTMSSLSSGYSANRRTVSGTIVPAVAEADGDAPPVPAPNQSTKPAIGAARKNRIVAPPPAQYLGGGLNDGHSKEAAELSAIQPGAKMIFAYTATGEGELTVEDGDTVVVVEPDGKYHGYNTLDSLPTSHALRFVTALPSGRPRTPPKQHGHTLTIF
jgi:formin-binding protein 1